MKVLGIGKGERNGMWQGGLSSLPYPLAFDCNLKERIRKRDGRCCAICNRSEAEFAKRLFVHHIDGNKDNNNEDNLQSLCPHCSGRLHGVQARGWKQRLQMGRYHLVSLTPEN